MAKKITDGPDDDSSASQVEVVEENPKRGGSYTRDETGALTQTEGHGFINEQDKEQS